MCFDDFSDKDKTPKGIKQPPLPASENYPQGAEWDAAYREDLRRYWTAYYAGGKDTSGKYAIAQIEAAMNERASQFSAEEARAAAELRAGPKRPARAIVFDVRSTQQALARSRSRTLMTGTLGLPDATRGRKTLLGGM